MNCRINYRPCHGHWSARRTGDVRPDLLALPDLAGNTVARRPQDAIRRALMRAPFAGRLNADERQQTHRRGDAEQGEAF